MTTFQMLISVIPQCLLLYEMQLWENCARPGKGNTGSKSHNQIEHLGSMQYRQLLQLVVCHGGANGVLWYPLFTAMYLDWSGAGAMAPYKESAF